MAGRGPAPKPAESRVGRKPVARGEWLELPRVSEPPPDLPPGDWSVRVAAAWRAWWSDPASTMWGPAQLETLYDLMLLKEMLLKGTSGVASEIRQREDMLGLSAKGKQDRRWRVPLDEGDADDAGLEADPYAALTADALSEEVGSD